MNSFALAWGNHPDAKNRTESSSNSSSSSSSSGSSSHSSGSSVNGGKGGGVTVASVVIGAGCRGMSMKFAFKLH